MDSVGREIWLDAEGKQIPRDDKGNLVDAGMQRKGEIIETDTVDNPLTDDAGNVIEAGTIEALLRRVQEHFEEDKNVTILRILVRETRIVREVGQEELAEVK